ncbi:hypothetical protein ScPMuIL_016744 [Solemya velum]
MGRHLNLTHLSEDECEKILLVIQKDFDLRQKEKKRLSKIAEVVSAEVTKTGILTNQTKFNEKCCIRCCETFGIIFNRKTTCQVCKLYVCKSCCDYEDSVKGYICQACYKEYELKLQSCDWFYKNINHRFKRFGSAKVVRSLYKRKSDSDNESDSGYDLSLCSTLQSGSLQTVTKSRPQLRDIFPELSIGNKEFESVPTTLDKNQHHGPKTYSPLSVTTERTLQRSHDRIPTTEPKNTNDVYRQAFENTKHAEEQKFRKKLEDIVSELHQTLELQSPRGHLPTQSSTSYGDLMVNYESQVRELLSGFSQRLQIAIENFDTSESPTDTQQRVKQMISRLVEDSLGESLDLTSDEAVSDLSSLSDESGDNKRLFEDQLAQAVVFKVLENHRKKTVPCLQLESEDFVDHGGRLFKDETKSNGIQEEFEKLRCFIQDLSPRPAKDEHQIEEDISPIEEKPMKKDTIDYEEKRDEFATRFSSFDRVHENRVPLPDFGPVDFEFTTNEVDPDLLSMNLAPILEEDEEGLEEDNLLANHDDWNRNWIFKGSSAISPYKNCGRKRIGEEMGEVFMTVPVPENNMVPQIGSRDADELSDLSENDNDNETHSSDGLSDEENSFYAKTSEEIARITRKSRTKKSPVSSISVQTEEQDLGSSSTSENLSASLSDTVSKSQSTETSGSEDVNKSETSKSSQKLIEDLVPAEGDDPKFEIPPQSMKIVEGEPAKISCRVAGTSPIEVLWYKVESTLIELENSENYEISKEGNRYQLTLYNLTKADAGQYMCVVGNDVGQCSQYFIININENKQELKAPEFLKGIKDMEVTEGRSIKFRCKVKGYPQPRIIWYKDGQMLKSNSNCKIERFGNRDYILTIDCATMDDDAEYTVMAKNIAGETKSSAQLIIEPSETEVIMIQKETVTAIPQDTVTVTVVNKNRNVVPLSPSEKKDEQQLMNLGQKLQMTKDDVSSEAENMFYTATELSEFYKTLDAMDHMLNELDCDVHPNTGTSDTVDKSNNNWVSEVLCNKRCMEVVENYNAMKSAAESIRHMTTTALDVLKTTNEAIKTECDTLITNTRTEPVQNSPYTEEKETQNSIQDHEQLSHISAEDKNNNTPEIISKEDEDSRLKEDSEPEDSHRSETFISITSQDLRTSSPSVELPSAGEHEETSLDFSVDTQDFSESEKIDSYKKEQKRNVNTRDFFVHSEKPKRRKWEVKIDSYSPSAEIVNKEKVYSPSADIVNRHTQEEIYLTAGKVFSLEDKVCSLKDEMDSVPDDTSPRHLSGLVDKVARTVAQVEQSEKEVKAIEKSLSESVSSLSPLSPNGDTSFSSLSAVSFDSGICVRERPEQTVMYGTTSEEDIPESRAEYNTESGIELPSVNRLKSMFSKGVKDEMTDGAEIKRIHSITARSLPKQQLEKIRRNANQGNSADSVKTSRQSMVFQHVAMENLESKPTHATNQARISVKLNAPEKQTNRQEVNEPNQIFPEEQGHLFPRNEIAKSVQRVSTPVPQPMKTTLKSGASPEHQSRSMSHTQQQKGGSILVSLRGGHSPAESLKHVGYTNESPATQVAPNSVKRMASPKIKSGSIFARAAFWEKKIQDGGSECAEDFPEMLEDCEDQQ